MTKPINIGDKVSWEWDNIKTFGQVIDLYNHNGNDLKDVYTNQQIAKTAKALLIELADGQKILKLEHEVTLLEE